MSVKLLKPMEYKRHNKNVPYTDLASYVSQGRSEMPQPERRSQGSFVLVKKIMAFVCVFCLLFFLSPLLNGAAGADHITLTWEGDPQTTQTITWRTEVSETEGAIQFAETQMYQRKAALIAAEVEPLFTNTGSMNIYSATLTGLKPGTGYSYQVRTGNGWSEVHSFFTAPLKAAKFKFLVFGDSQSVNYQTWGATLHQAYQANPEAAFFVNMGDLVDMGQDYAHWDRWFEEAQGVIDHIPVIPVTGNHETYTPERKFSRPVFFTAQFKVPLNGPDHLKRQVYSFDYGEAHFVVLDSQAGEQAQFLPTMLEEEREWLEQDLQSTDRKWKVVFCHRPFYPNKANEGNRIKNAFVPVFDRYHVDAVFTAHEHAYARTYPLYNDRQAEGPAGTVYVATGRSGTKTYQDTERNQWNTFFYNPLDEPNYLVIEVEGDLLRVKVYKQNGEVIDDWFVEKPAGLYKK